MSRKLQRLSVLTLTLVVVLCCLINKASSYQGTSRPAAKFFAHLGPTPAAFKTRIRALVPAYFDPIDNAQDWSALIEAGKRISIIAIINPNSGPGDAPQQSYKDAIARAQSAGITVIGYVSTDEGNRPPDKVRNDIDKWTSFYPKINGIFFDEQATGDDKVAVYSAFFAYARKRIKKATIIGNPGTEPSERYLSEAKADIECIFESWGDMFDQFSPPSWPSKYQPQRFAVLLHTLEDSNTMKSNVQKLANSGIGNVYLTDDELTKDRKGNPWDRLPDYWKDEVEVLRAIK